MCTKVTLGKKTVKMLQATVVGRREQSSSFDDRTQHFGEWTGEPLAEKPAFSQLTSKTLIGNFLNPLALD